MAVNTLQVQVASLSVFMDTRLAKEALVIRFLFARERVTPVTIDRFLPWDLTKVLEALTRHLFEPIEEIS